MGRSGGRFLNHSFKHKQIIQMIKPDYWISMRLSENVHLLRYPHPSSLRRTSMYASFLGISEALHMNIFHQPLSSWFFDTFYGRC